MPWKRGPGGVGAPGVVFETGESIPDLDFCESTTSGKPPMPHFISTWSTASCTGPAASPSRRASAQALYAVWNPGEELDALACEKCRPVPAESADMRTGFVSRYHLRFSIDRGPVRLVLKERGREYRNSAAAGVWPRT